MRCTAAQSPEYRDDELRDLADIRYRDDRFRVIDADRYDASIPEFRI